MNPFKNKNVMITGHTGFKGSWLTAWLHMLGANITAVSKDVPTIPAHYDLLKSFIQNDITADITKYSQIHTIIKDCKPNYIFHLAAQPIVLTSYEDPYLTFQSNSIGTLNILESLRIINPNCTTVIITSDKCYENLEKRIKYKENDRLGGKDPYSASKACAEIMITAYCKSFFKNKNSNVRLASSRAGNVIGGGDWAKHRIIPDCIRAWSSNREVEIRNSQSTRPWQHVLEPLSGYLTLAYHLDTSDRLNGESFNFGPDSNKEHSVGELVNEVAKQWANAEWTNATEESGKLYEANLLNLDCNKALEKLNWKPLLDFEETSAWTGKWYNVYYNESKESAMKVTQEQVEEYSGFLKFFQ